MYKKNSSVGMAGDVKKRGREQRHAYLNSVVAWINSKPPQPLTEHEQKIERRWRPSRWVKRLRRLARRSLEHEYRARKYRSSILATAWRRLARRFLHVNRRHHLSLANACTVCTKWRTLVAGYLFATRLAEWRWDVKEGHAAYIARQRTAGAPTSRYWKQQLHETRVAIDLFECNWINKVWRNRDCLMHMAVISLPFAEMVYARLALYRKPSQDQDRPVAAEQSATSLAQLGRPVAAEQSATSLAQLGRHTDVQGQ